MRVRPPFPARRPQPPRARLAALAASSAVLPLLTLVAPAPARAQTGPVLLPGSRAVLTAGSDEAHTVVPARTRAALRGAGSASAPVGAVFSVTYSGFSVAQRDAFQRAVDTWGRLITSRVPIRVDARLDPLPEGVLGSAGPTNMVIADGDGSNGPKAGLQAVALANAKAGHDLDPGSPDISATFSKDASLFSYGDRAVTGRYDFTTVVLHEIAHGLGFAGAMDVLQDAHGASRGYWDPGTSQPRPLEYDRHTVSVAVDGTATPLLSLPRGSVALARALTGQTAWAGPAGTAANGGKRPLLYSPRRWDEGSSYSHLDEDAFPQGDPNSLMTPVLELAEVVRDPGDVALGMLADLGWGSETAALRVAGPRSVRIGSPLTITGAATPGSTVSLLVRQRSATSTATGFALSADLSVDASGRFAATLAADDDLRYYVRSGSRSSTAALTQVRPVVDGPALRVVRPGTTVVLTGRGQPRSTLRLRFTRGSGVDLTRLVPVGTDGRWRRPLVLTADLRALAVGANSQAADTGLLLQAR